MLRSIVLGLFSSLLVSPIAFADGSSPLSDARLIVEQQLSALERDNAQEAYSYTAPGIQAQFADSHAFFDVITTSYAPMRRHRSVEFGQAAEQNDVIAETVIFTDENGQVWDALYQIEKQPGGVWKISGCVLAKSDQQGV